MGSEGHRMFIETSGECAIHFDLEAKCVTDTGYLFHRFGEEEAQMFKKVYSLYSAFCTQPAFYSQSAVCILHSVCILPLVRSLQFAVRSLQFAVRSLRFTLTDRPMLAPNQIRLSEILRSSQQTLVA